MAFKSFTDFIRNIRKRGFVVKTVTYEIFKKIYELFPGEPEFYICFEDKDYEYMIIKYADGPTFQRCGTNEEQSGEIKFKSLDELYNTTTIDNIILKDDWEKIEHIYESWYGNLDTCCDELKIDLTK